jgi:CHAT domain-containing protein
MTRCAQIVCALLLLTANAVGLPSESLLQLSAARDEFVRGSSVRALVTLERAIQIATTADDEAAARAYRIQAVTTLGLARDGEADATRLLDLLRGKVLSRATARTVAMRLISWHRTCADLPAAPRERHLSAVEECLELASALSTIPAERGEILELRSYSHAVAGRFEDAWSDLSAAESIYDETNDVIAVGRCHRRAAFVAYLEGEPREALARLERARPLIPRGADGRADLTELRTHEVIRALASLDAGDFAGAERAVAAYIACSAELLEGLPWVHVLQTHRISEPTSAAILGALHRYATNRPAELHRVHDLATAVVEGASARLLRVALGRKLAAEDGRIGRARAIPPEVVVVRFHEALDERTSRRELLRFATRDGEVSFESIGDSVAIDAELTAWFDECLSNRALSMAPDVYAARTRALTRKLLGPVVDWLTARERPCRRLVVITDGLLSRLPFDALVVGDEKSGPDYAGLDYLVRHASIVHLPALSVLDALPSPPTGTHALVILDPELEEARPRLRFTAVEKRALLENHPGAVVIEGAAATEPNVVAAIAREQAGWLHLACHAEPDGTLRNTALLRLARDDAATGEDGDGVLTAGEIFTLPLFPGARVVLSACNTALGDYVRGEGILGLWRAFLTAGASCVVSTIRDVDDRCVATFMARFHAAAVTGIPLAEAARAAALDWLDGSARPRFPRGSAIQDGAHPFLWANYICIGDDGGALPERRSRADLK